MNLIEACSRLKSGYQIVITNNNGEYSGVCLLRPHEYLVSSCDDVDIGEFISRFQNIRTAINEHNVFNVLTYDFQRLKYKNQILKKITSGPYCENIDYELVNDFEVLTDESISSYYELEEKIGKKREENIMTKQMIKK